MATFTVTQIIENENAYFIPNATGCNTDLTVKGAANNYACVNDPVETPNDDTDYVYTKAVAAKHDLYELPDHTTETGVINYIQIFSRTKSHEFTQHIDGIHKIILTENVCTNIYKSDDIDLITSYTDYSNYWTENPRTSTAWTWNDIDNLQIGIESSSPSLAAPVTLTLRPNAVGNHTQLTSTPVGTPNWDCINELVLDGDDYVSNDSYAVNSRQDVYAIPNPSANGTITKVVVFAYFQTLVGTPGHVPCYIIIRTHGINPSSGAFYAPNGTWNLYSKTWNTNPSTGVAWTWGEINDLEIGCKIGGFTDSEAACAMVYTVVYYDKPTSSPEIRTTQCYVKVNYIATKECTLNKPEEISVEDARNIKMLNFWSGNKEVYDLSRNKKSIVLTGSEYQSSTCDVDCPCERITCMREMGKKRETITITGLRTLFNGDYKIRSFGWKHVSQKPEYYDWILELEYDD